MRTKKILWLTTILLILVLMLSACGQNANDNSANQGNNEAGNDNSGDAGDDADTSDEPAPEKHLIVSQTSQYAETFDISIMPTAFEATQMLYDGLISVDSNGEYVPGGLTESYEVSDDGTVTTFHLKEGITFHDGSDFNAGVVKWNIELVQMEAVVVPTFSHQ